MARPLAIKALLLAGGQSRRMGSDKGLRFFRGRPMVRQVAWVLGQRLDTMVSIRPGQLPDYRRFFKAGQFVFDAKLPWQGPLRGIMTAHIQYPHDDLLVAPVDMPFLDLALVDTLLQAPRKEVVFFNLGGFIQPMPAVYSSRFLKKVFLQQTRTSRLYDLVRAAGGFAIKGQANDFRFKNLNTPVDLI